MGYTKLFSSIVASTIWREDDKTRIVWITMLAMKNERHEVESSLPGLADMARVTIAECEKAVKKLESKDGYSRNQANGGRRIERTQGGWKILNGEYYQQKMSEDDRREYQRNYHREYRQLVKTRTKKSSDMGAIAGSQDGVIDACAEAHAAIQSRAES
jgi:hypothetical protein